MMILAQKIQLSGSAFRTLWRILGPCVLVLAMLSACTHAPVREQSSLGSVRFGIKASDAASVDLVLLRRQSDQPALVKVQARRLASGLWTVDMDLLPGEYRYFFLVDGVVKVDDGIGRVEEDDFGGVTGVLRVFMGADGEIRVY